MNTAPLPAFPAARPRRLRRDAFTRNLVREHALTAHDLIYPVFVLDGQNRREAVASMPGVERLSLDLLLPVAEDCVKLGIPVMALFPVIDQSLKTPDGREAFNPDGLIPRVVAGLKARFPELGVMTDVALDPYPSHGQDGLLDERNYIINDATVEVLVKQALAQAAAGVDIVAPSDMMDGRVRAIREALDAHGFADTPILSYAAKFASAFYGPFREAAESAPKFGDRRSYQMDAANAREALREVAQDIAEGADLVMVKPALACLDIIYRVKTEFGYPTAAYAVSAEYSMIKAAAANGWIDERAVLLESHRAMRRAGADILITYAARELSKWLKA